MCLCVLTADWPDEYMVQYVVSVLYFIRANKMITFEPFPKGSLQREGSLWESGGGSKAKEKYLQRYRRILQPILLISTVGSISIDLIPFVCTYSLT